MSTAAQRSVALWIGVDAIAAIAGLILFFTSQTEIAPGFGAYKQMKVGAVDAQKSELTPSDGQTYSVSNQLGKALRTISKGETIWFEVKESDNRPIISSIVRDGTVLKVSDNSRLTVQAGSAGILLNLSVAVVVPSSISPTDTVWFNTTGTTSDQENTLWLSLKYAQIGYQGSIGSLLLAFAVIWGMLLLVTKGHPWAFALGLDQRLSNSQTQIFLWFVLFTVVYVADLGVRVLRTGYFGGIDAPARLLALSGISALTFSAARASTMAKVLMDPVAARDHKGIGNGNRSRYQLLMDLFTNDAGAVDLGDSQMILLTGLGIIIYLFVAIDFISRIPYTTHVVLPPVESALLGGTGVSQGAYLLKKIGSRLGN
ncbi:MAG: hypothetical protein JOY71_08985 [Acetobacteraceae bacterium]|nr:hypothetical protein [Acetobacteraceae bacterium]